MNDINNSLLCRVLVVCVVRISDSSDYELLAARTPNLSKKEVIMK
jgi:hypothetical protein